MANVAESRRLVEGIVRLRRAERIPEAARDVAPVRRDLESRLGPTLSRSRAAHILGVSQTALDRWVDARRVPVVLTPRGRREVPRQFVVELREAIDDLLREGHQRHLLAQALERRRKAASEIEGRHHLRDSGKRQALRGHGTAARRGLAFHALIADRLDEGMVEEARERVEQLASEGHLDPRYADRWRTVLDLPLAAIPDAMTADTEEGRDLRQNSPFAGVLNEQERRRIIEATR
jgi:predicted transcriptional regulator